MSERANALGLNGSSILTGAEHEIGYARAEDRLRALGVIQRVDQRKCFVVLVAQRTDRTAFEHVARRLSGGQARRHGRLTPRHREIDRQVVPAKLQHPRCGHRRRPQKGQVILVLAEADAATPAGTAAGRAATAGAAARCAGSARSLSFPEHFIAAHDVRHFPIPISTQRRREQAHDGSALRRRHISQSQTFALKHGARKVGPSDLLRSLERELHPGSTRIVERGQERLRSGDNAGRRGGWSAGRRGRRRSAALSETCRSDGDEQAEADSRSQLHR